MGLDPEGYGNPDFCWLSIYDTLIWSFAGPVAFAVSVGARKWAWGEQAAYVLRTPYKNGVTAGPPWGGVEAVCSLMTPSLIPSPTR